MAGTPGPTGRNTTHMRRLAVLLALIVLPACSKEADVPESAKMCAAAYDGKVLDQCIAACIKCEKGVTTTCATACKLRGAK